MAYFTHFSSALLFFIQLYMLVITPLYFTEESNLQTPNCRKIYRATNPVSSTTTKIFLNPKGKEWEPSDVKEWLKYTSANDNLWTYLYSEYNNTTWLQVVWVNKLKKINEAMGKFEH